LIHNYKQFKSLNSYVNNRPAYLKEIQDTYNVDKDNARILINMIIFGGSFTTWRDSNNIQTNHKLPIIKDLQREIKQISEIISDMNPLIAAKEKRNNQVLSIYLQEIENRILEAVYEYCSEQKYVNEDCVLCFDGIMMRKDNFNNNILQELHILIRQEFNLSIEFIVKPMDRGYTSADLVIEYKQTNSSIFDAELTTDGIANHFASKHKNKFVYQGKKLYYYNGVYWKSEDVKDELISLNKFIRHVYYEELNQELGQYEKNYNGIH
jgi:hypothetical protein